MIHTRTILLLCSVHNWLAIVVQIVAVSGGRIQGAPTTDGGAAWKGIPFARPPVGDLRWRAPQPVVPWKDTRETTRFSIACTQLSGGWNERFVATSGEDCLYLNVATPKWPVKDTYPVMVWIHGGSNLAGDADDAGFDARTLVHYGIVLVTINYRLGALGFLGRDYGLMDQIAALRWVRDNIARFGGDPHNVTVFGESAGAFDIGLLMASPMATGLFHRAIAESGAITGFRGGPVSSATEATRVSMLRELKRAPAPQLLQAEQAVSHGDHTGLEASVDHWVLPESPADVFASGRSGRVPLLIGTNSLEFDVGGTPPATYGADTDAIYGGPGMRWSTDVQFRCPAQWEALRQAHSGEPTYQYEFWHPQPGHRFTAHASEVAFLFGEFPGDSIASQMQRYWTNFARTGDPNGPGLPRWDPVTDAAQPYMAFTNDGAVIKTDGMRRSFCPTR
jgi:para-nitrobenzyl esterase